jgi:hypothetical protein
MNLEEYNLLKKINELPEKIIDAEMLAPFLRDRTLLYGYTLERKTWHVYIKDKIIHKIVYDSKQDLVEYQINDNYDFIPDKRLYPETCDYHFCKILIRLGYELPFTNWDDKRLKKQYYGLILATDEERDDMEDDVEEESCGICCYPYSKCICATKEGGYRR